MKEETYRLLYAFNNAEKDLFDLVGFEDSKGDESIEDTTDSWWKYDEKEGTIKHSTVFEQLESESGDRYYESVIMSRYAQQLYRGDDLTLVLVWPDWGSGTWGMILDNDKRVY